MSIGKVNVAVSQKVIKGSIIHYDVTYDNQYYYRYEYDKNGNCYTRLCGNVVNITEAMVNILTGEISYHIEYRNPQGVPYSRDITRDFIDEKKLLSLKKEGMDVNTETAVTLVKVLENQERLVNFRWVYNQLGWNDENGALLYFGLNKCIGMQAEYHGEWNNVKKSGSKDTWISMVKDHVIGHTAMELALGVGFASTAIGFLRREIPTLDYMMVHAVGNSSSGKSTAAELIVSMGSYPKTTGKKRSMMLDYSGTDAAIIKSLTQISSLPCAIDEASVAQNKDKSVLIYQIALGRERARLNPDASLKDPGNWESVVFSTGEHNILNFGMKNAGLWVRCINIALKSWTDSAQHSNTIKKVVMKNYGHITEEFAEYLLNIRESEKLPELIQLYNFWQERLMSKYKEEEKLTDLTVRLSGNLAVILTALQLGSDCFGLATNLDSVADLLVEQCSSEALSKMDIGENAYNVLMQEIVRQPDKIKDRDNKIIPSSMWGSYYSDKSYTLPDGRETTGTMLILESALVDILQKNHFLDPRVVLENWREKKILVSLSDRTLSKKKLIINGLEANTYEIRIISEGEGHNVIQEIGTRPRGYSIVKNLFKDKTESEEDIMITTDGYIDDDYDIDYSTDADHEPKYGGRISKTRNIRIPKRTDGNSDN